MLKNALSALYLLTRSVGLTRPAQIYYWEMQKSLYDFGDLDPLFNVVGGHRMLKMPCMHSVS